VRLWELRRGFELALLAEGAEIADPVRLNQLTLAMLQKVL